MKKCFFIFFLVLNIVLVKAQIITTVAGNGTQGCSGDGGQGTNAALYSPWGLAVDKANNLYIADANCNLIRKLSTSGIITTFAGNGFGAGSGVGSFGGDGGQATAAMIAYPQGVTFDILGNLYIADYLNGRIRKVDTNGIISTIAGGGIGGFSGDGGQATAAELFHPNGVAFDRQGNLYIAGSAYIRKVNLSGIIATIAGGGTCTPVCGDGGYATNAVLTDPSGIIFDKLGNLFIADAGDNRLRKIDTLGIITTLAGGGSSNTDGVVATTANLGLAAIFSGIIIDSIGNLYIPSSCRIRKIDTSGIITTVVGNGTCGNSGDGGLAINAELGQGYGLAWDANNNLFISNCPGFCNVRKVTNFYTLGLKELNNPYVELTVYPNPTTGTFDIIINENANSAIYTIEVTDLSGRTITSIDNTQSKYIEMNLKNLPSGFYFVKVISPNWQSVKKVIIQN